MMSHVLKDKLSDPRVRCANTEHVLSTVDRMLAAGSNKLQVVSDFDRTLTEYTLNGLPGVVENSSLLSESFRKKTKFLRDKYQPLEVSHKLTSQEKIAIMEEWWGSIHQVMVDEGIKQESLPFMVDEANIGFREFHDQIMCLLDEHSIPLTVFSAGLSDTIRLVFNLHYSRLPSKMCVVGNKMIFDENGVLIGFNKPVIHSFNKGVTNLDTSVIDKLKDRTNIVLLGDSQGDPDMCNGLPHVDNIVKIGFLNHDESELLPVYEKIYDIVLIGADSTLEIPYVILKYILPIN